MMNNYENSKQARRVASVVYLIIMTVIMTGTYLSQKQKEADKAPLQNEQITNKNTPQ
jgi:hypothetical protein